MSSKLQGMMTELRELRMVDDSSDGFTNVDREAGLTANEAVSLHTNICTTGTQVDNISMTDFNEELQRSRVYRKEKTFRQSTISIDQQTLTQSYLSAFSLAEVSNISVINLAVTLEDVHNNNRVVQTWPNPPDDVGPSGPCNSPIDDLVPERPHWCYHCGKFVLTCDGWKRHMKEHERYYVCMPYGPKEVDISGLWKCAFGCIEFPDDDHLAKHHVDRCLNNAMLYGTKTRKSRKASMISHLGSHGVFGAAAPELAAKWSFSRSKQGFACGFCIRYSPMIQEQLDHIDEHYRNCYQKSDWNTSTVIKGLLRQPRTITYLERLLANGLPECEISWYPDEAQYIQGKLEKGYESGADLALLAYVKRVGGWENQETIREIQVVTRAT